MGSSIPAAVDYLVAQVTALPECALPVVVYDGWPLRDADVAVAIGVVPEGEDIDVEVVHAQLGANLEYETPVVPCIVWARKVAGDPTKATKQARDAAFAIYDAIVAKVRADRTLGGAVRSGAAIVTGLRMDQTSDAPEAGEGRTCELRFHVAWKNRF